MKSSKDVDFHLVYQKKTSKLPLEIFLGIVLTTL